MSPVCNVNLLVDTDDISPDLLVDKFRDGIRHLDRFAIEGDQALDWGSLRFSLRSFDLFGAEDKTMIRLEADAL